MSHVGTGRLASGAFYFQKPMVTLCSHLSHVIAITLIYLEINIVLLNECFVFVIKMIEDWALIVVLMGEIINGVSPKVILQCILHSSAWSNTFAKFRGI